MKAFPAEQNSTDEMIIPYKGKFSQIKQYVKGKPQTGRKSVSKPALVKLCAAKFYSLKVNVFQEKWRLEFPWLRRDESGAMFCDSCKVTKGCNAFGKKDPRIFCVWAYCLMSASGLQCHCSRFQQYCFYMYLDFEYTQYASSTWYFSKIIFG
jgi:hypothetical protein